MSAAFFDYDKDGDIDAYAANQAIKSTKYIYLLIFLEIKKGSTKFNPNY
jgi:hypothetical protein